MSSRVLVLFAGAGGCWFRCAAQAPDGDPNSGQASAFGVSISPTRVGVHHGRWKAAVEEMVGSRPLVRNRVGRFCGQFHLASLSGFGIPFVP